MNPSRLFLPYQVRWLKDRPPVKIWEKSRRIGATYVQSYEDVEDCVSKAVPDVWFSSADASAAEEYILYCEHWAKLFNVAAKNLGMEILDEKKNVLTYSIDFPVLGRRIIALTSNPKSFRSKGGKVVLDEFAWHEDQEKMWAAASPCTTWGFPLRLMSTHNGAGTVFNEFVTDIREGKSDWSLHRTPIQLAVAEGLADKITRRALTDDERAVWLETLRRKCRKANTWEQEYCCNPVDESTAFLPFSLIATCEALELPMGLDVVSGELYVGMDIGRKKDLSVIWVLEKLGPMKFTRKVIVMEKTPFRIQRETLYGILRHPKFRRACIDNTGIGTQLAEEAREAFGTFRVEEVTFSEAVKEDLATHMHTEFEDRTALIPPSEEIRDDLHSVRKVVTKAGHIRFDAASDETDGHADRFWALALALSAARTYKGPIVVASRRRYNSQVLTAGY